MSLYSSLPSSHPYLTLSPHLTAPSSHKLTCACSYGLSGDVYSITYQSIATQWISSTGVTWELVRNTGSGASPQNF